MSICFGHWKTLNLLDIFLDTLYCLYIDCLKNLELSVGMATCWGEIIQLNATLETGLGSLPGAKRVNGAFQCAFCFHQSFTVYCPFPGFLNHGKILLISKTGLYEYRWLHLEEKEISIFSNCPYYRRPYVRKIGNSRQIMFQCDRGFSMIEPGPSGATCVAGKHMRAEILSDWQ